MSKKVLVATDGSEQSNKTLIYARDYAGLTSANLIVLFVNEIRRVPLHGTSEHQKDGVMRYT